MLGNRTTQTAISFGPFVADLQTQELRKHHVRLRLPGQSFQILKMLLERPGELVTREELQQALWPSETFVDFEHGVNAAVNRLREALGDSADNPAFIETLPRRGYKFIAPVKIPASEDSKIPSLITPQETSRRKNILKRASAVAAVAVLLLVFVAFWRSQPRPPTVINTVRITNDGKPKNPLNPPVTDGVHLYFTEGMPSTSGSGIAQVSAAGGETTLIPTSLKDVLAVSPVSPLGAVGFKDWHFGVGSCTRALGATIAGRSTTPRRKHRGAPRDLDAGWLTHRLLDWGHDNDCEQKRKRA